MYTSRELRMVPPNWAQPRKRVYDELTKRYEDRYIKTYNYPYRLAIANWIANHLAWEDNTHPNKAGCHNICDNLKPDKYPHYASYAYDAPRVGDFRPDWKEEEMTWYQVYTQYFGEPVTPPFATRDELVEYLVENGDFWDQTRRREGCWLLPFKPWPRESAEWIAHGDVCDHAFLFRFRPPQL